MDIRFGTWNVSSLYMSGSLKIISRELPEYKLHLVEVQDVRWDKGGAEPADYTFFHRNGNAGHHLGAGYFVHKGIISPVKMVEFVNDRMSYILLTGY
jgi:hypothetical protein